VKWWFGAAMIPLLAHDVRAQCVITAVPVNFGVYQPFSASPIDSTGSITIRCRLSGPYSISLNAGLAGDFADRHMSHAGSRLVYQLYTSPARRVVWGDGTGGSATVSGFCSGYCSNDQPIYGRIPARQSVAPGTYTDTVTVTVIF
jgi:spore coat protein U-like protein